MHTSNRSRHDVVVVGARVAGAASAMLLEESTALERYQQQRDQALREIFDITCRLAAYPPVPAFIELQKQLSAAIDNEAAALATRPVPGECLLFATLNAVKQAPEAAKFQFPALSHPGKEGEFERFVRETGVPRVQAQAGHSSTKTVSSRRSDPDR